MYIIAFGYKKNNPARRAGEKNNLASKLSEKNFLARKKIPSPPPEYQMDRALVCLSQAKTELKEITCPIKNINNIEQMRIKYSQFLN